MVYMIFIIFFYKILFLCVTHCVCLSQLCTCYRFLQSMLIPGLNFLQITCVVISNLDFSLIKTCFFFFLYRDKTAKSRNASSKNYSYSLPQYIQFPWVFSSFVCLIQPPLILWWIHQSWLWLECRPPSAWLNPDDTLDSHSGSGQLVLENGPACWEDILLEIASWEVEAAPPTTVDGAAPCIACPFPV